MIKFAINIKIFADTGKKYVLRARKIGMGNISFIRADRKYVREIIGEFIRMCMSEIIRFNYGTF